MAGSDLNKTIWMCWFQGWDKAPDISKRCVESWIHYNPGWDVILLDNNNYKQYISIDEKLPGLDCNYIALGDVIRVFLLKEHGGIWADSTTWCNKPLDDWIHDYDDSFFCTRGDQIYHLPALKRVLETWFMMAKPNSYMYEKMYEGTIKHWTYRINETDQFEHRYAPINIMLDGLLKSDPKIVEIFNSRDHIDVWHDHTSRTYGNGPHLFTPYPHTFFGQMDERIKNRIDSKVDPLYKLTYKEQTDWRSSDMKGIHPSDEVIDLKMSKGSPIEYLLNSLT